LVVVSEETGLRVNADKTKYTVVPRDQNTGEVHNILKKDDSLFEMVDEFKCFETLLTIPNFIKEQIKSRLKSGNACYHSVHNLLSSSLLSKNTKIKIHKTIIFFLLFCKGVKHGRSLCGRHVG
jgi:hypothetical protein